MEFLAFWTYTSIISIITNIYNDMRILKYAADAGSYINLSKLFQTKEVYLRKFIPLLIPGFNIITTAENIIAMNMTMPQIYEKLVEYEFVYIMPDFDKYRYLKKRSVFNALKIHIHQYIDEKKQEKMRQMYDDILNDMVEDNPNIYKIIIDDTTEIIYEIDGENINIVDVKSSQGVSEMTENEAKAIVIETRKRLNIAEPTIEDQINDLEKQKEELLNMFSESDKDSKCINSNSYIKK